MSSKGWNREEGRFQGERGVEIYYQAWLPSGKPKATLVLAHGIGEHSGRYAHVGDHMARAGYALWACDHRGHGKSGGKRGHVDSFDQYLADVGQMIEIARQRSHGAKVFLIGHSLGGLIALDYAEKSGEKLAGLIVSSPGLRLKMKVSPVKALLAKMLSGVAPSPTIKTGLDSNLISRDREVVRKYVNDPLVHGVVTPRWTTEFLAAEEETIRDAQRLKLPCLILQAGADGLVDPSATIDFFKKVGASDKTLKVYDGFYHEILNEPGKDSVLQEIDAWLSARV